MRIDDKMLKLIIDGKGSVDGISTPTTTGVWRLALDLQDAREKINELEWRIRSYESE